MRNKLNVLKKFGIILLVVLAWIAGLERVLGQGVFQRVVKKGDSACVDAGVMVREVAAGGYLVSGNSVSGVGMRLSRVMIGRMDAAGDTAFVGYYGVDTLSIKSIGTKEVSGGYVTVGNVVHWNSQANVFVMRTDGAGNVVWFKCYSRPDNYEARCFQVLGDGGVVVTGAADTLMMAADSSMTLFQNTFLMRMDVNGDVVFGKKYGFGFVNYGSYVIEVSCGGYVIAGHSEKALSSVDIMLLKTDVMGNLLWQREIGALFYNRASCVSETSDGGLIVTGTTGVIIGCCSLDPLINLVKTDGDGNLIWARRFGCFDEEGYAVVQTNDGGYAVTGTGSGCVATGFDHGNAFLIKVDSVGENQWCNLYSRNENWAEYGQDIVKTSDGGYAMVGQAMDITAPENAYLYLIKTDGNGASGCNDTSYAMPDTAITMHDSVLVIGTVNEGFALGTQNVHVYRGAIAQNACEGNGVKEVNDDGEARVFPNPSQGIFEFQISNFKLDGVKVYDVLGTMVNDKRLMVNGNRATIDLTGCAKGLYFVEVHLDKKIIRKKIVVD